MLRKFSFFILWIVALFYAYGAAVHLMNMLSLTGFDWLKAPLKWQLLDITYLVLDLIVAIGFFLNIRFSYVAFYIAALSQIVLYTLLRSWITDVPEEFAVSADQMNYLNYLVTFHLISMTLVTIALIIIYKLKS